MTRLTALLSVVLVGCAPLPPRYISHLSISELEVFIAEINEPREVQQWLEERLYYEPDEKIYGVEDFWASCALTYQNMAGDCEDYAICAAALLQEDVEQGFFISLTNDIPEGHAVFAYRLGGKWGIISNDRYEFREPLFSSFDEAILDINRWDAINNVKLLESKYQEYMLFDYRGLDIVSYDRNLESKMKQVGSYDLIR